MQRRDGGVLDLALIDAPRDHARNTIHFAKEIGKHLKPVAAKIHHRPASTFFFLDEPMSWIARLHIDVLEGIYLYQRNATDLARGDDLFCSFDCWIKMSVVSNT